MIKGKRNIIRQLLKEQDIETAEDIQDSLKDLPDDTIKEILEAEMDEVYPILYIDAIHYFVRDSEAIRKLSAYGILS